MGRYVVRGNKYIHESDLNKVNTRTVLSFLSIVMVMVLWYVSQFVV